MPTNVNITVLMDAEMKQLAAVKDEAAAVKKALVRESSREDNGWIKFTGANGREIHLAPAVYERIAVINEIIVQNETPSPIEVVRPPLEIPRAN